MRKSVLLCIFFCFRIAEGVALPKPQLLSVITDEGAKRFQESKYTADFFPLANQFESQTNRIFCGPATLAIVLNAVYFHQLRTDALQVSPDESLLDKKSRKYLDSKRRYVFNRYTQNNVFDLNHRKGANPPPLKTKLQVLGAPMPGTLKADWGLQLRQLGAFFLAHGAKTELRVVDDKLPPKQIRKEIVGNLGKRGDYVVVNYLRSALGQEGSTHISPIAAYHQKSDTLLILDVNPNRADWVWVKFDDLIRAMKTFDTVENRGYLLVSN